MIAFLHLYYQKEKQNYKIYICLSGRKLIKGVSEREKEIFWEEYFL